MENNRIRKSREIIGLDLIVKDRKGFLLAEETLKVILAVIAIGFLAFLLFSIYGASKDSKSIDLAKESLDFLQQEINAERATVEIYNPEEWFLMSWSTQGQMPRSCSNLGWNSCICICKKDNVNSCDEEGVCDENKEGFSLQKIKIEDAPIVLSINYENKVISGA